MSGRARVWSFLRSAMRPRQVAREMDEEIGFHIASRAADLEREGLSKAEAMRRARVEFGGAAGARDGMRAALGLRPLDEFLGDLRYAARLLARSPSFTLVTVLSLALAIGANSAVFSTANELLFARLGVPRARELRSLVRVSDERGVLFGSWNSFGSHLNGEEILDALPYPVFRILAREQTVLGPLFAGMQLYGVTMSGAGSALPVNVALVSGGFYAQMEVRPVLGRALGPADDRVDRGAPLTAVLSYGFWQKAFGGKEGVLGRTVRLNGSPALVVGVNPPEFTGAESAQISPDLFVPLTAVALLQPLVGEEHPLTADHLGWVKVMARAKPGVADSAAAAQLTGLLENATRALQTVKRGQTLPWITLDDGSQGVRMSKLQFGTPIHTLVGLVGLVLLLACVNVANLQLARGKTRARELSLRLALGAGRARLLRQILTECLLTAALGGGLGGALAYLVRGVLPRWLWGGTGGSTLHVSFDGAVFAFTAGITMASALLSGLAPAWQATRQQPGTALKEAGLTGTRRRRFAGGKLLVIAEVALSMMLLAGAGLFLRTVVKLNAVETGFNPRGLLLFDLFLPQLKYPAGRNLIVLREALDAVRGVPGVASASITTVPLLSMSSSSDSFYLEHPVGASAAQAALPISLENSGISADFFRTMQIPRVAGRAITAADEASSQRVAVINRAMARKIFGNVNPIGRRFSDSSTKGPWTEIVGICGDTLYDDPKAPPPPLHFDSLPPGSDNGGATFVVRSSINPELLTSALRRAIARIDPDLPLTDVRTQEKQIAEVTEQQRLMADLSLGFAALALGLACVGVYAVLHYSVAERTREIGIRLALGARRAEVRGMVLREAGVLAVVGIGLGLGATVAAARLVRSMLFGVAPTDPVALGGAGVLLLGLALVAAWVPAARAARIDPMEALRHE